MAEPSAATTVAEPRMFTTLSVFRTGARDPTTQLSGSSTNGEMWRATLTPDGPGTLLVRWSAATNATSNAKGGSAVAGVEVEVEVASWGPGGAWLEASVPALLGRLDAPVRFVDGHPAVLRAQHRHPGLRLGASGTLYHELLPIIIGQRITGGEAVSQWHRLIRELGAVAPGPRPDLRLPPAPDALVGHPAWWYHQHGIEAKRAEVLRTVGRHAAKLWAWALLPPAECAAKLALLPGVGPWTIGSSLGPALGDADAFAIGDYHLKNVVSYALASEPRGTDERMVELLRPYVGQRGRVVRLLALDGHSAPKYGPRRRILPMRRW